MNRTHFNSYDKLVFRNGCRPAWMSDLIPNSIEKWLGKFFDLIFKDCCNDHDDCFAEGYYKEAFDICNNTFYFCMKRVIKTNTKWYNRWFYNYKAWQYYKLVSKFGWGAFTKDILDMEDLPSYQSEIHPKIVELSKQGKINIEAEIFNTNGRWEYLPLSKV